MASSYSEPIPDPLVLATLPPSSPPALLSPSLSSSPSSSSSSSQDPLSPVAKPIGPEDFVPLKVIGTGTYGKVFLVRERSSGRLYAMKTLRKAAVVVHSKYTEHTKAERQILEAVQHPFIVKLYYAFQTARKLYLVLEYVPGGELFTHLAREKMFDEEVAVFVSAQIILALEHLHSVGVIYRDLKPENILLGSDGNVVLTDFGLSKVSLDDSGTTNTICGTVEYMAPEVVMERLGYDFSVDWWSLGILIHDMLTGSAPFRGSNRKATMDSIMNRRLKLPSYLSPASRDLLTKLLKKHPKSRLGAGPGGVEDLKKHPFFRSINWSRLLDRKVRAPFVPIIVNEEDTSNFDKEFTSMAPIPESPHASPVSPTSDALFQGFSFISRRPSFSTSFSSHYG
ncbi:kinase-like domain-containing protein [Piptocephalis cylindrospora]|uniref:Kinase-like domain-containing protein n=1 Tax=Piptocephalis cylindrospora TaxID=1907219 RepID=A0A4P9Y7H5_9FUNG|nr:kinase-like domain-containing protein [Piptocephalis cylindrospora]|eukprot:RKP13860.1 kinase-like domain-containing protein [Piptocephalis cylindrospora]